MPKSWQIFVKYLLTLLTYYKLLNYYKYCVCDGGCCVSMCYIKGGALGEVLNASLFTKFVVSVRVGYKVDVRKFNDPSASSSELFKNTPYWMFTSFFLQCVARLNEEQFKSNS